MTYEEGAQWTRRAAIRAAGASVVGAYTTSIATAAQASGSVEFGEQESNGESVVIASVGTSVDARLFVVNDRREAVARLELDAGTEFTDRTVTLDEPLQRSQVITVDLADTSQTSGNLIEREEALVAVNESLASARRTIRLPEGRADIIEPDPDAGFRLPYALYRPESTYDGPRPLLVQPNNNLPARSETDLLGQLRETVTDELFAPARDLGLPGIVPGLPRTPSDGGDRIQALHLPSLRSDASLAEIETDAFPAASLHRVDQQVVRMVQDARERLSEDGYPVANTIHMTGFSGAASFSARFAFLYPSLVNAVTFGGSAAPPLPERSIDGIDLPYPLGTADYEIITGREFDRDRWNEIAQYIFVGGEDQPLPSSDERGYYPVSYRFEDRALEVFGRNRVTERLPFTESVYTDAGANATFRIYDGVGHTVTDEIVSDLQEFHSNNLDMANDRAAPSDLILADAGTTPTPTVSETPTVSTSSGSGATATTTSGTTTATSGSTPGFGPTAAIAGLGTGLYLLSRRLQRNTEE
jgi:PGF-CTERM protein